MAFLKRIIFSRFFLYVIGMLVAALVIWFIGPLIGIGDATPLSGVLQRTLAIVLIPAILGLGATFSSFRLRQNNAELEKSLTESPQGKAAEAANEEVSDLGKRLKEALALLKKSRVRRTWGSAWLYQLPWYMFIGPPGSGKTTALVNSGLSFPLAEQFGKASLRGVGGTRSCEWWFTDDAVLIDTAGRYTTQDSDALADAGAWTGFLKLLKKNRKRQPINGAIVAIGLSDLLYATEDQRAENARAVRTRLKELYSELGVRFPVYVLFTKSDLIAGFVEFFEDLNKEDREQVWGMTFETARSDNTEGAISGYIAEFDALVGRLNDRLMERLQNEPDIQRRALIFGFPQQMASLREITDNFLKEVFQPNRFEEPARLRGIYFTSGTQEGTPIDRLMSTMASSFGIQRQQVAVVSGTGRSYFLTRLLKSVIFGEAGLVSADAKLERRNRLIRWGVAGVALLAILVMTGAWIATYSNNTELIANVETQAAAYNEQAKNLALDQPVSNSDLQPILPLLNILRNMPGGYAHNKDDVSLWLQFGLYQGDKLGHQATNVYRRELGRLMLPRMLLRLEGQLQDHQNQPDFLYEALKVYLMLGQQGKLDKQLVKTWMDLDWRAQYPGAENEATVQALEDHLDALLEKPLPTIAIDATLVEQTRTVLRRQPLAERAYELIKTQPEITSLPVWRISEHGGPAVDRAIVRRSGKPLSEGIPGLYTHDGYFYGFKPLLPNIAKEVTKEGWVIGQSSNLLEQPGTIVNLQKDVTSLYLEDFAAQWDKLLADISVVPVTNLSQAAPLLNVLSAPDSPLKAIWVSAANETWLSKPPTGAPPASQGALLAAAGQAANQAAMQSNLANRAGSTAPAGKSLAEQQLTSVLGQPAPGQEDIAGSFTDKRFKPLHDLVSGGGNGPPPIDTVMADLDGLYREVNAAGASPDAAKALTGGGAGGGGGAAARLQADAQRLPAPVAAVVASVAGSTSSAAVGGARAQLNGLWTSQVAPFCQSALDNRYPIYSSATNEVTLDDFARLFAKGGLIDAFFDANLKSFVDVSKNPWAWQKVDNTDLGIPPAVLAQFQRAAAIRDSMFPGGGGKPGVNFDVVPVSLDSKSSSVVVEIDGQTVSYDNGPPRPVKVTWPGPSGVGHVRVAFQPQSAGETTTIEKDGVWSWFRLLQESQLKETTGADRYQVTFHAGSRSATFELRANSVVNPFSSHMLEAFRCPPRL
jgi:type VI secretion system protein ImpL